MRVRLRVGFGLLFLVLGILLAVGDRLPAGSCGRWFTFGNSASRVHYLLLDGRDLMAKQDWRGAAEKFAEAADHCPENAGYFAVGQASALASYSYEKAGEKDRAVQFGARAERVLSAVGKGDPNHGMAQFFLRDVRTRLAHLRPLHPVVQANLIPPPPFAGPMIPLAYRREGRQWARRSPIEPGRPGALRIESSPGHAAVSVDGSSKGRTPLVLSDLKPGRYWVVVTKQSHRTEHRIVRLAPGASLALSFELQPIGRERSPGASGSDLAKRRARPEKSPVHLASESGKPRAGRPPQPDGADFGRLIVESRPPAFDVAVDGVRRGKSPLVIEKVSPGLHAVEVGGGSPVYQSRAFEVEIRPGETFRLGADVVVLSKRISEKEREEVGHALRSDSKERPGADGRPPIQRVAFLDTGPASQGRPLGEVIPVSELPEFLRRASPPALMARLEVQRYSLKNAKGSGRGKAAENSGVERPPFWRVGPLPLGLMGLGLACLAGAFVGWRKRQEWLKGSTEVKKVKIQDLESGVALSEKNEKKEPAEAGEPPDGPPELEGEEEPLDVEKEPGPSPGGAVPGGDGKEDIGMRIAREMSEAVSAGLEEEPEEELEKEFEEEIEEESEPVEEKAVK